MELPLDGRHVRVDVGVVILEIVEDQRAWPVVDELRALVEEGRVVFVRLDHEEWRRPEARARPEVRRHAADQEAGLEPRVLEDPGEKRRSGGLAVRAGDGQYPAIAQHLA